MRGSRFPRSPSADRQRNHQDSEPTAPDEAAERSTDAEQQSRLERAAQITVEKCAGSPQLQVGAFDLTESDVDAVLSV